MADILSPDFTYKLIMIGDPNTGKTSITDRYEKNCYFPDYRCTIGVEFATKTVNIVNNDGKKIGVRLHIWDTAGQEAFRAITKSYYRTGIAALLVFDITNKASFDNLTFWITEIITNGNIKSNHIMLVGNKVDQSNRREVTRDQAIDLSRQHDLAGYMETSACTGEMIHHAFHKLAQEIYNTYPEKYFNNGGSVTGIRYNRYPSPYLSSINLETDTDMSPKSKSKSFWNALCFR